VTALYFLLNATVGVGYVTMPKICTQTGLVNAVALLLFAFLISSYGSILILKAYHLFPEAQSYAELTGKVLGKRWMVVLTVAVFIQLTWTSIIYFHINFMIVLDVLRKWFGITDYPLWARLLRKGLLGFVVWRLLLRKELQRIRMFGLFSNLTWAFFVLVLASEMPQRYHQMVEDPHIKFFGDISIKTTVTISNLVFGFANHPMLISTLKIMKDSQYSWVKIQVHIRSHQIALICYAMTICFGYIQFGKEMPGMVLLRPESPDNPLDIVMTLAQIAVFFGIAVNIVNYTNASLDNIQWMFPKDERVGTYDDITDKNKLLVFGYVMVMVVVCIFLPFDISPFIDSSVSILSPIYMVVVPGLMALRLSDRLKLREERVLIKLFMLTVTTSMLVATSISLWKVLGKFWPA
jgi:amino acid permease